VRARARALLVTLWAAAAHAAPAASPTPSSAGGAAARPLVLYADLDDDDDDGVADRDTAGASPRDVFWMSATGSEPRGLRAIVGDAVRVTTGVRTATASRFSPLRGGRLGFQGLGTGRATVDLTTGPVELAVCAAFARDASGGLVDLVTSHASLSRALPEDLAMQMDAWSDDDALAWGLACPSGTLPKALTVESFRPSGHRLDMTPPLSLVPEPCGRGFGPGLECAVTRPVRATVDVVDRVYPTVADRSLAAEVGGRLVVTAEGRKVASIRVGGPRTAAFRDVPRLRARLRFHLVREAPSGLPPVGGDDAHALALARAEARSASMLWGQCGVHFGPESEIDVRVVDPPPRYLLAVGCDVGLPASGGVVAFVADGKHVRVPTRAGEAPVSVAGEIARAVARVGLRATVSLNARIASGALRTADVLVRRADGTLVDLSPEPAAPLSTDASLTACIGEVNLADGLSHFDDLDSPAGTLEERTLVKALQDDDPSTIEVLVVPGFSRTGRIGESFIDTEGSQLQNVVIVDRTGIRSGARSYALPHELGHVLLDLPGHPDDFGVDRPWMLMDADATDASIFGPRRLSVEDCERALRQSGPGSNGPLLEVWPLVSPRRRAR
jgi:hypothetical protein